jgi:hypothetical protein
MAASRISTFEAASFSLTAGTIDLSLRNSSSLAKRRYFLTILWPRKRTWRREQKTAEEEAGPSRGCWRETTVGTEQQATASGTGTSC